MAEYLLMATRQPRLAEMLCRLEAQVSSRSELSDRAIIHESGHGRFHLTVGSPCRNAFFDGMGVFGDRLAMTSDAAPTAKSGRGVFMTASHADDGTIVIAADPLGTYPVFYYNQSDLFGISNNVFFLTDALAGLGRQIPKDLSLFASFVAFGGALNGMTGYREVNLIPLGSTVTVLPNNTVSIDTPNLATILYSERSFECLLDEAVDDIACNIRAIADGPFNHLVSDLTGGMDSRLVLAAILHAGKAQDFAFHTLNRYPDPDANTAALIRAQLGLRPYKWPHGKLQTRSSLYERMCRIISRVGGLFEMFFLVPATEQSSDSRPMRLGGGLGELMREFWSSEHKQASPITLPDPALSGLIKSMAKRSWLLTPAAAEALQQSVYDWSAQMIEDGIRGEHLGTALYLTSRNNYHFGVFWRAAWRSRFHPLYSPAALQAAHRLLAAERRANRVGYELIKRFYPQLIDVPFAEKSWSPLIMPHAPAPITKTTPSFFASGGGRRSPRTWGAERTQGKPATLGRFAQALDGFRKEVAGPDFTALQPAFNVGKVAELLGRRLEDFSNSSRTTMGCRLLAAHAWINDMETDRTGRRRSERPSD